MSAFEGYLLGLAVVMFLAKFAVCVIQAENGGLNEAPGPFFVLFLMFVMIDVPLAIVATQNVTLVRVQR